MRRRKADFEAVRRELGGRCFIREFLAGNPDYEHKLVYQDELVVALLQRFQTRYGYVLVAPREHRERIRAVLAETGKRRPGA